MDPDTYDYMGDIDIGGELSFTRPLLTTLRLNTET